MQNMGKQNMQGFSCKRSNVHARIKWKWGKFKHAMVEIKYGITTDLSVGKGSKFRVFWTRHFIPSTLIGLTKQFQSVTPLRENYRKSSYLDVVSGVLGIIIWSMFDWVELLTIHIIQWYCPWSVRNYLPGLHRDVVAFSVDAVFITVGDQATTIENLFKRRIRAFSKVGCNHVQLNCRSVDFSKSRVPSHACLQVDSDSSWKSLANWNWSETTPVFTQKEDSMVVLLDHWPLTIEIFLT